VETPSDESLPARRGLPRGRPERILVTIQEAAEMLSISDRSIYNLVGSGELRIVKLGRAARVAVADVHAIVAMRMIPGPDVPAVTGPEAEGRSSEARGTELVPTSSVKRRVPVHWASRAKPS
jgi:excisionase family DNA binding protein